MSTFLVLFLLKMFVQLNFLQQLCYRWDSLTGDLELVDSVNGHYDVVYGMFDPRYLSWYVVTLIIKVFVFRKIQVW